MQRRPVPQSTSVRHSASAVHAAKQALLKAGRLANSAQGASQPRLEQPVLSASASAPSSSMERDGNGPSTELAGAAEAHPAATAARAASPAARARCSSSVQPPSARHKTMATVRFIAYEHRIGSRKEESCG